MATKSPSLKRTTGLFLSLLAIAPVLYSGCSKEETPSQPVTSSAPLPEMPLGKIPEGKIAFISDRTGKPHMYIMSSEGVERLTESQHNEGSPAWSPDGKRIAFVSVPDNNDDIFVMNADGTGRQQLTNHPRFDSSPCWSPDGKKIAYVADNAGKRIRRSLEIYSMDTDGSNKTNLTQSSVNELFPSWTAGKIAYSTCPGCLEGALPHKNHNSDIFVLNLGSGKTRLTSNPSQDMAPAYSPDGKQIAFCSDRDGAFDIFVMNADGTDPRNLTRDNRNNELPSWSPDGNWIAYASLSQQTKNLDVYIVRTDGTDKRRLTNHPSGDTEPAWMPSPPTTQPAKSREK